MSDGPGGRKLRTLRQGDILTALGGTSGWVAVQIGNDIGTIARRVFDPLPDAAKFALEAVPVPPPIPPEASESDIKLDGKKVLGPKGIQFGIAFNKGLVQYGLTSLARFFAEDPAAFPRLKPSIVAVMCAVSDNEGRIEAINTYDNAFLSCGIYQWTLGTDGGAGELAYLLASIKRRSTAVFAEYFGKYGIDAVVPATGSKLPTGHLLLNGTKLDSAARKEKLRQHIWAYRFWRAAHAQDVRRAQVELAIARIDAFYPQRIAGLNNRVSDYISSQVGVAHLLDEHVNRPGHVPGTLRSAIQNYIASTGKADPARWTSSDERAVILGYLALRHNTNMTASAERAKRITDRVKSKLLSDERGSF